MKFDSHPSNLNYLCRKMLTQTSQAAVTKQAQRRQSQCQKNGCHESMATPENRHFK